MINTIVDAYRADNHAPASSLPYRVRVDGKLLRDEKGEVRKFANLWAACGAGAEATSQLHRVRITP